MIRNKLYLFLAFVLMVNFISCDDEPLEGFDEEQEEDQDPNIDAIFQATLSDTINFTASEIAAELTDDGLQFSGTMNNKRIGFSVPNLTIGPKDLSSGDADGFYDTNIQELISDFYTAQQGTLNIESIDSVNTMISGTFSGDFQEISSNDSISITEGVFTDIVFEDNTNTDGGQGGDIDSTQVAGGSLIVDIDGDTREFDFSENSFPDDQDVVIFTFIQVDEDDPLGSQVITMVLPSDLSEGNFDVNNFADQSSVSNPHSFRYDEPSNNLIIQSVENSGQINLSTVSDSLIEGTFNFNGQDLIGDQNLSFTNGSFTIELE